MLTQEETQKLSKLLMEGIVKANNMPARKTDQNYQAVLINPKIEAQEPMKHGDVLMHILVGATHQDALSLAPNRDWPVLMSRTLTNNYFTLRTIPDAEAVQDALRTMFPWQVRAPGSLVTLK